MLTFSSSRAASTSSRTINGAGFVGGAVAGFSAAVGPALIIGTYGAATPGVAAACAFSGGMGGAIGAIAGSTIAMAMDDNVHYSAEQILIKTALGTVFGAYSGYVGATINADCEGAINTIGVSLGFTNISTIMEGIHTIIELTINRSIEEE